MITSDLKWKTNTEYMCKNAFRQLWLLKRLRNMGASVDTLLDVYEKQIRCKVEFAVPAWASSINKHENMQIERLQKAALAIIFQHKYKSV